MILNFQSKLTLKIVGNRFDNVALEIERFFLVFDYTFD